MTEEAQRIAISEACGWVAVRSDMRGLSPPTNNVRHETVIPNYLSDLNAMHGAEKKFVGHVNHFHFGLWLYCIVNEDTTEEAAWLFERAESKDIQQHPMFGAPVLGDVSHATAAQRAEAFIRTIGKWDDSK